MALWAFLLKPTLLVGGALAALLMLRRAPAAVRHALIGSALIGALLLPVSSAFHVSWALPSAWFVITPAPSSSVTEIVGLSPAAGMEAASAASPDLTRLPPPQNPGWPDLRAIALVLWAAGTIVCLTCAAVGLGRLSWLSRHAKPLAGRWQRTLMRLVNEEPLARMPRLFQSSHPSLLLTWGIIRPAILVPPGADEWDDVRIELVLRHELAHVRRGDWLVQLLADTAGALYWFNPLIWIACRQLRDESELACDAEALAGGISHTDYAEGLLHVARALRGRSASGLPALAMARPSTLERRVRMILARKLAREPRTGRRRVVIAALVAAAALAIGTFRLSAQSFATLNGSVSDEMGGAIPHVTVSLASPDDERRYQVRSGATGQYQFVGVVPGDYRLEVAAAGFETAKLPVTVVGTTARDVSLRVGTLQEMITVVNRQNAQSTPARPVTAKPQAAGGAPASAAQACTTSGGGKIEPPSKLVDVRPRYPATAASSSTGGRVLLDAVINTDGTVKSVEPADPSSSADLVAAASEAVRQWRFTPTLLNCVPIEVRMTVQVDFRAE
jgi:TonB family protein